VITRGTIRALLAIDGRHTVEELVDRRGVAQTVTELATLAELGLIRVEAPAKGRPWGRPWPWRSRTGAPAGRAGRPPLPAGGAVPLGAGAGPGRPSAEPALRYWQRSLVLAGLAGVLLALNLWAEARIAKTPRAPAAVRDEASLGRPSGRSVAPGGAPGGADRQAPPSAG
jgi:hypothetical protein